MKVRLTQAHIAEGTRYSPALGPVAIALTDAGLRCVNVERYSFTWYDDKKRRGRRSNLPRSARRFIARFDSGKAVEPFNFEVKL